jgi:hypothetical protein
MSQWNLVSTKVSLEVKKYDCCPELYQSLKINFTLQRLLATSSAITTPTIGSDFMLILFMLDSINTYSILFSNHGFNSGNILHSTGDECKTVCGNFQFGRVVHLPAVL